MTSTSSHSDWDGLTWTGQLLVGVLYAGTRHKEYTLRIPVAGDMVKAQIEHPQGPLQAITIQAYRYQLLKLGAIPEEALTYELLSEQLSELDLAILAKADEDLEKKLKLPSVAAASTGEKSSTPLSGTATG